MKKITVTEGSHPWILQKEEPYSVVDAEGNDVKEAYEDLIATGDKKYAGYYKVTSEVYPEQDDEYEVDFRPSFNQILDASRAYEEIQDGELDDEDLGPDGYLLGESDELIPDDGSEDNSSEEDEDKSESTEGTKEEVDNSENESEEKTGTTEDHEE